MSFCQSKEPSCKKPKFRSRYFFSLLFLIGGIPSISQTSQKKSKGRKNWAEKAEKEKVLEVNPLSSAYPFVFESRFTQPDSSKFGRTKPHFAQKWTISIYSLKLKVHHLSFLAVSPRRTWWIKLVEFSFFYLPPFPSPPPLREFPPPLGARGEDGEIEQQEEHWCTRD